MLRHESNRLIREFDSECIWIEPWGANSLRVRVTKTRAMPMPVEEWALLSPTPEAVEITVNSGEASITNGKISARLTAAGKIIFLNQNDQVLLEEFHRNRREAMEEFNDTNAGISVEKRPEYLQTFVSALEIEAREFDPILGGDYRLTARFESNPEEKLFGMGQYQQPFLNIKGCTLELAHRNSQASVPFVLSSLGYGFLWHNPAIGRVTFGTNVTEWYAQSTNILDYWITAGDTPAEIEEAYARATGTVPMMPDYAMGFWQCKLRYRTQDELLGVAREYKRRGLPLSVIVADFFHWPNQGDWKFDMEYWPDPKAMVAELKAMGIELMVSIWPTVEESSENFKEMLAKGYLIRADRGNRQMLGGASLFDATHPGAREFVWSKAHKNYYQDGIKLFWLDEAEPEYSLYQYDNYRYHLGPDVQIGNIYPVVYARTFFEGMRGAGQQNVINLLRCAWAGSQKYGALVWSGDIDTTFRSMRNQFAAGLNMGLAGIPWWTTDIGGFHGGSPDDPAYREVFSRWFAYGAFCPVFRLHGFRDPHKPPMSSHGGGKMLSGGDNEVWSYGDEVYAICTRYMLMRERLKPYITSLMEAAYLHGTPVMRTLFYEFPADSRSWEISDQYMFGPDLLVAPVMQAGLLQRQVYLPQGAQWTNAWNGEKFAGGQTIIVEAPMDIIPLFLRDDAKLPIQDQSG
jgi:alpha-D-xyloside xylohydrolase